jgi:hypothetical protein
VKKLGTAEDVDGPGGGADACDTTGLFCSSVTFFCSCNLCLIFAIASASRSCFSHLEYDFACLNLGVSGIPALGL